VAASSAAPRLSLPKAWGWPSYKSGATIPPLGEAPTPYGATDNVTRNLAYLNHTEICNLQFEISLTPHPKHVLSGAEWPGFPSPVLVIPSAVLVIPSLSRNLLNHPPRTTPPISASPFKIRYSIFEFLAAPSHQSDLSNSSNLSDLSDPSPYHPKHPHRLRTLSAPSRANPNIACNPANQQSNLKSEILNLKSISSPPIQSQIQADPHFLNQHRRWPRRPILIQGLSLRQINVAYPDRNRIITQTDRFALSFLRRQESTLFVILSATKNLFFITQPPKPDSKVNLYSITQNTYNVQRKYRVGFSPPKLLFGEPYARYETNSMKGRNMYAAPALFSRKFSLSVFARIVTSPCKLMSIRRSPLHKT
jgi:hypothetical protein